MGRPRLVPSVLAAAGTGSVLVGVLLGLSGPSGTPPRDLGVVPAAAPVATPSVRSGDDVRSLAGARPVPTRQPSRPVAVRLPGEKEPTVLQPIAATDSGVLDPPERVTEAGWWKGGARVGDAAGSIVLAGHVDAHDQGEGAFAALWRVRPGQTVAVRAADGRSVTYRITGRRSYPRSAPLPAALFSADVAPRLVLITCAGRFNRETAHYSDSLAVFAVPV